MKKDKIVIVGGGISGLAAAYRLCELNRQYNLGISITVLEASDRFGGVIHTQKWDEFLMEGGPDAFLSEKPWALDLAKRLGLESELIGTNAECRRSFLLHKGKLAQIPEGFYLMAPMSAAVALKLPFLSWWGKIRMVLEYFVPPRDFNRDESLAQFVRRRFGGEVLERIAQPMIGGIYTANPEELSIEATFNRFRDLERDYGSVIRGLQAKKSLSVENKKASGPRYSLFVSFKQGMEILTKTLIEKMPEVNFVSSCSVHSIKPGEEWTLEAGFGKTFTADHVCLAVPAHIQEKLIKPFDSEIAGHLSQIPYESVATINVAYHKKDVPHHLDGFGFVVPAVEGKKMVGCTFSSVKFQNRSEQPDKVLLRIFIGGALHPELYHLEDEVLTELVREELESILGIKAEPIFMALKRYPKAMPQYRVGHLDHVQAIENLTPKYSGLYLIGNGFRGIGIPDCIRKAEQAAEEIYSRIKIEKLQNPPHSEISEFDHILVVGFGGPTKLEEVQPFLAEVTKGFPVSAKRLAEVVHHYEAIGGRSPYNDLANQMVSKLKKSLIEQFNTHLPIFIGMRNWNPFLKDTIAQIKEAGLQKGLAIILAPHRCYTSFERYIENVEQAKKHAGAEHIQYQFLDSWFDHPLFIEAQAEEIQKTLMDIQLHSFFETHVIFTAHSIPLEMKGQEQYVDQLKRSCELVSQRLKLPHWSVAYQSRSGNPSQAWLEPDVIAEAKKLKDKGVPNLLVVPIGFLSDHAEVLYDLDIQFKEACEQLGIQYARAKTTSDNPKFIQMFSELIHLKLNHASINS